MLTTATSMLSATLLVSISTHGQAGAAGAQRLLAYYTDPGSGALLLQLLTTSGFLAMFYFRRVRNWVAKQLGLEGNNRPNPEESPDSYEQSANPKS
jgi:hypothetical protein